MKKKYIIYLVLIIFISCKNEYKTYYPNGALHILSQENGNHKLDGEFKEFYENGTIEAISNYTNGRLDSTLLYEKKGGREVQSLVNKTFRMSRNALLNIHFLF